MEDEATKLKYVVSLPPLMKYGTPTKKGDPKMFVFHADKATKRIIAPFVNIVKRGRRLALAHGADKDLEYFLEKKPSVLKRNLNEFLDDAVDLPTVMHDSVSTLKRTTRSAGARLYMVKDDVKEIYISPKNQPNPEHKISWKIEEGTILAAYVAAKKEYVVIEDVLTDPRFPKGVPYTDPTVKGVLCVPVVTPKNECLAVIELYRDVLQPPYEKVDLKIAVIVSGWMGTSIHQNKERMVIQKHQKLNECLMELTKCYFAGTITLNKMINEVVTFAKEVIDAEKATFYILNAHDMTADIYDESLSGSSMLKKQIKAHFDKEKSIASTVAKTGQIINIQSALKDYKPKHDLAIKTGSIERSILAMPIMGVDTVLGVVEAVNKVGDRCFSKTDEEIFRTFTLYCALALYYSKMIEAREKSDITYKVSLSLLKRHLSPCSHDLDNFRDHLEFTEPLANLNDFTWYATPESMSQLPQMVFYMITHVADVDCLNLDELKKFILSVKMFYRDNPYHNFLHGFTVCHCMYNVLKRNLELYTTNERNALVVAALCHDIDHGGVTNSFLHLSEDPIAQLYQDSAWEHHHYYVTMLLLGEIHIFESVSTEDYKDMCQIIEKAILATDLAVYFRIRAKVAPIVLEDAFDWNNPVHRHMLISITMTSCDLSGSCKPFPVAKQITDKLCKEFYRQGDIEKSMGYTPLSTMDRDKAADIPEIQVEFLTVLVIPACDLLRKCFPNTSPLYNEACNLKNAWLEVIKIRDEWCWNVDEAIGSEFLACPLRNKLEKIHDRNSFHTSKNI